MAERTACVYFTHPTRGVFGHVTAGKTLFEIASEALDWFADPHWKGPRPGPDTLLEITLVGDHRRWLVRVGRVMEWRGNRQSV